ncbi:MAG: AAA family ATPase [Bacillota bacterium]
MIKRIDIQSFGSFKDFSWRSSIREGGNVLEFKRLNILYGRNYSGKTTLSRIMRSLQEHKLPGAYKGSRFVVSSETETIDQTMVASHSLNIRVYNKDFVDEHLSFLRDSTGNITPFAIVGSENKSIQEQIDKINGTLGNREEGTGLRRRQAEKQAAFESKQSEVSRAERDLREKLSGKAGSMKHKTIYEDPNYNRPKLEADIQIVRRESTQIPSEEQQRDNLALLAEVALPDIKRTLQFSSAAQNLYREAQELLGSRITPTRPIRDLLDDALLQAWVKAGIQHHRDKRSACGFCGQPLPPDLWDKLDAHFSTESQRLTDRLQEQVRAIELEIEKARGIYALRDEEFYSTNHRLLHQIRDALDGEITKYVSELEEIKKALRARQDDIFNPRSLPVFSDNSIEIIGHINSINALIAKNNQKTVSLSSDQSRARRQLRLSEVAQFIQDAGLVDDEKRVANLQAEAKRAKEEAESISEEIADLENEVRRLLTQVKDERKGAEKVNEYLNHFFGHQGLRLVAVEDPDSSLKFQILRGSDPAYNLSEGECSLVAVCYFMAKLEDAETQGKELIVYIDDPISSLDSNHIFFVYSLVEAVLAKPNKKPTGENEYRYRQMFISTHNLDFLKYLKRLSAPKDNHGGTAYFLLERREAHSYLSLMPTYLKHYTTEFNYLFDQIYKCRDPEYAKENYQCFYSFGNNLRKFLEAYLFYRYPYHDDHNDKSERMMKFFGSDRASAALTSRLVNELSHLEEIFDRSMRPLEIPEISSLANFVLDTIYEKDPEQYNSLLKSIGEPPRAPVSDSEPRTSRRGEVEEQVISTPSVAAGQITPESTST